MTTGLQGRLGAAVAAALVYIAVLASGMYTAGHVFGVTYLDVRLPAVLLGFEVVASLFAIAVAQKLYGHWHSGFDRVRPHGLLWMLPNFIVMAVLVRAVLFTGTPNHAALTAAVLATAGLIGLSEEVMFRGVVLRAARDALGRAPAVLISALLFALLHAAFGLVFEPPDHLLRHIAFTFTFGLAMGCFALGTNSLVPVIVFHALWDMVLFVGALWGADFGRFMDIATLVNLFSAVGLALFVLHRWHPRPRQ